MLTKRMWAGVAAGALIVSSVTTGATGAPGEHGHPVHPQPRGARPTSVVHAAHFALSKPLRTLDESRNPAPGQAERAQEQDHAIPHSVPDLGLATPSTTTHAPLVTHIPVTSDLSVTGFQGMSKASAASPAWPPDPNGAAGPNDYVQIVNSAVAVYDKTTEQLRSNGGPFPISHFWATLTGKCSRRDDGDPIVLYDAQKDRWLLSQFAFSSDPRTNPDFGPFHECLAVSRTGDPLGRYAQYDFKISKKVLPDYPKLGVWGDGYYMTSNRFRMPYGLFEGAAVTAFERRRMLRANPYARMIDWTGSKVPSLGARYGILPASNVGTTRAPAGRHEYFIGSNDDSLGPGIDLLYTYKAVPDWGDITNSRLVAGDSTAVDSFNSSLCNFSPNCIPQKGTSSKLDALAGGQMMYPFAYRYFSSTGFGAYVVDQTVNVGSNRAGVRWYELEDKGKGPRLYQQGRVADSSLHRWLGSMSIDGAGDIALGYSASSGTSYPSLRVTARGPTDPADTLGASETVVKQGGGSQTSRDGRWGDYSSMSVDPDGCTFWYTNEFYPQTSLHDWHTWVGHFTVPGCEGAPEPSPGPTQAPLPRAPKGARLSRLDARPDPFSPNGDGYKDHTKLSFHINHRARVHVTIYRRHHRIGRIASRYLSAPGRYVVRWGGRAGGRKLRPDTYRFRVVATSGGVRTKAAHRVTVRRR